MTGRRLLGGGGVVGGLAVAAVAVLQLAAPPPAPPAPAPDCTAAAIFLRDDVTNAQRDGLRAALAQDPSVREFAYRGAEEAFERFEQVWREEPGVTRPLGPVPLPESFRVRLAGPEDVAAFRASFTGRDGVAAVTGGCR